MAGQTALHRPEAKQAAPAPRKTAERGKAEPLRARPRTDFDLDAEIARAMAQYPTVRAHLAR